MCDQLQAGHIGRRAHVRVDGQQPLEVSRDHHGRCHAVPTDEVKNGSTVELPHDDDGPPQQQVPNGCERAVVLQRTDDDVRSLRELRALTEFGEVLAMVGDG